MLHEQEGEGALDLGSDPLIGFLGPTHQDPLEEAKVDRSGQAGVKEEETIIPKILDGQVARQKKSQGAVQHQRDDVGPAEYEDIFSEPELE
jgi:hypothetical protein